MMVARELGCERLDPFALRVLRLNNTSQGHQNEAQLERSPGRWIDILWQLIANNGFALPCRSCHGAISDAERL